MTTPEEPTGSARPDDNRLDDAHRRATDFLVMRLMLVQSDTMVGLKRYRAEAQEWLGSAEEEQFRQVVEYATSRLMQDLLQYCRIGIRVSADVEAVYTPRGGLPIVE